MTQILLLTFLLAVNAGSSKKSPDNIYNTYNTYKQYNGEVSRCGAVMLVGQAFRFGGQGNQNVGSDQSKKEQFEAFQSHKNLLNHLEEKYGCRPNIFLKTQSTKFDEEVREFFGDDLKVAEFSNGDRDSMTNTKDFIELFEKSEESFPYYLMVRIDMILKPKFLEILDPNIDAVQFTHLTWKSNYEVDGYGRVADLIFCFPRKQMFTYASYRDVKLYHNLIRDMRQKNFNGKFHAMIESLHDSDSAKDWTPLYRIANRRECQENNSEGWVYSNRDYTVRNESGQIQKTLNMNVNQN